MSKMKSFWHSVNGMLTAFAAIITIVTGLIYLFGISKEHPVIPNVPSPLKPQDHNKDFNGTPFSNEEKIIPSPPDSSPRDNQINRCEEEIRQLDEEIFSIKEQLGITNAKLEEINQTLIRKDEIDSRIEEIHSEEKDLVDQKAIENRRSIRTKLISLREEREHLENEMNQIKPHLESKSFQKLNEVRQIIQELEEKKQVYFDEIERIKSTQ